MRSFVENIILVLCKKIESLILKISIRQLMIILLTIFAFVILSVFAISTYKTIYSTIYQERAEKLKYVVDFANEVLNHEALLVSEHKKTLKEAQNDAIEMIQAVRFENNDYIWINNYDGAMIHHPYPHLIGTDVKTYVDPKGYNFGMELVNIPKTKGSGYLRYYWTKPHESTNKSYPKLSYIFGFKKWDWVLGSGVYVDDITTKVLESMLVGILPVLCVFLIFLGLFRSVIWQAIVIPIENLANKSLQLANNDLSVRLSDTHHNKTELGKLYSSFNKFVLFFKEKGYNETKLSLILDSISDAIITLDKDGKIISSNPAAGNIFGYDIEELIDCNIESLFAVFSLIISKKGVEAIGLKKDGTKIDVEYNANVLMIDGEEYLTLTIRDITHQKEMERTKNEFISMVSHELRTPLTSIKGSLGLVISGVLGQSPNKVIELLNIANNNCTRLIQLINDILDLEKIKAGKMTFNLNEYEINTIAKEAIKFNEAYASNFNISLELEEEIDKGIVKVDKDKIIQVITNLLSNAIKFSKPHDKVKIRIQRKNTAIVVSIEDKGAGIPIEFYSKIFQSFSQSDSSDTRKKGGTGLGLKISQEIIKEMGGQIGFESEIGKGSIFYFELPESKTAQLEIAQPIL